MNDVEKSVAQWEQSVNSVTVGKMIYYAKIKKLQNSSCFVTGQRLFSLSHSAPDAETCGPGGGRHSKRIEQILHLWNDHKLYLIMKFVICYAECCFSLINFLLSLSHSVGAKSEKCQSKQRDNVYTALGLQQYVQKMYFSSVCIYMLDWKYCSVAENCSGVWPEVFEWIIGQMYGVNIGVVSCTFVVHGGILWKTETLIHRFVPFSSSSVS